MPIKFRKITQGLDTPKDKRNEWDSDLDFDQVIQEFGRWVHVSYKRSGENRHKCSIAKKVDGKTRYFHYSEEQIEKGEYEL